MPSFIDKFRTALLGKPVETEKVVPSVSYGQQIDDYLKTLGEQSYMQPLLNQPKETALTLDQYKQGVAQGLNYGVPEIAKMQDQLGIRKPQGNEQIELARANQFNQPTSLAVGTATTPRQGGVINDLLGGYKENYEQGFDPQDLGQNKNWATRVGEGLGTVGRFLDKPIGRFTLATGLSALTGESNPLAEGVQAYVGRQQNVAADKAYRQDLLKQGYTADEINSISGLLTGDIYKNLLYSKQLQDQAENRKIYLENMQNQNEMMNKYRQDQLALQTKKEQMENYFKSKGMSIQQAKIATDKYFKKEDLELKRRELELKEKANKPSASGSGNRPRGSVKMQAPNGKIVNVPANKVQEALRAGGKRL